MNPLAEIIRGEILSTGPIAFARFMELALYHPEFGYYEQSPNTVGKEGDYVTNVSAGSVFGELLAWQFADWIRQGEGPPVTLVEAGAHNGQLAADVLSSLQRFSPDVWPEAKYWIIEPSNRRQQWQAATLRDFRPKVEWVKTIEEVAGRDAIIFSNELLDSLPFQRFTWKVAQGCWNELRVGLNNGLFTWQSCALDSERDRSFLQNLHALELVLPDGFLLDISFAAETWWRKAATGLKTGWVLTIDYGKDTGELLRAEGGRGTLRTYSRHQGGSDLLTDPGAHDITGHIHFSALQAAGERFGLRTVFYDSQPRFLTQIAAALWKERGAEIWTVRQRRQFQMLTHPDHLGRAFRVLVQQAGRGKARSFSTGGGRTGAETGK